MFATSLVAAVLSRAPVVRSLVRCSGYGHLFVRGRGAARVSAVGPEKKKED